jgi:folate-dependent phosphoribosylglycinamide formyltransferase PurN
VKKRWITLFSQTGSEIKAIADELGRWPDIIVTNNSNYETWEHNITPEWVQIMTKDQINEWLRNIEAHDTIITLHGYLRILPPDICSKFEIYNGHPAAVDMFPELRGKDPQEKTWAGKPDGEKYGMIGAVVHQCIEELDAGDIVSSVHFVNRCDTKEELYNKLKDASRISWLFFLRGKL